MVIDRIFELCRYGNLSENILIDYIVNDGNVKYLYNYNENLLNICCSYYSLNVIKLLIGYGLDINHQDIYGFTPLMNASFRGRFVIVKYLIENGANIHKKDNDGKTALMKACSEGYLDIVKYLIQNGDNVNIKNNHDTTLLMIASSNGYLEIVEYLIENGVDVNYQSKCGWFIYMRTALLYAVSNNHLNVVKYLIENGANIEIKYNYKNILYYVNLNTLNTANLNTIYYLIKQPFYSNKIIKSKRKNIKFNKMLKKLC